MNSASLIDLSRLQFAVTAMYHFLFVPLTLGLSVLVAIMESVFVMTGRAVWRDMTRFWGTLFGINFVLGVGLHSYGFVEGGGQGIVVAVLTGLVEDGERIAGRRVVQRQ